MNTVDPSKLADTAQKMKFSITDFFSKCVEEIRHGKLYFLCSEATLSRLLVFMCKLPSRQLPVQS